MRCKLEAIEGTLGRAKTTLTTPWLFIESTRKGTVCSFSFLFLQSQSVLFLFFFYSHSYTLRSVKSVPGKNKAATLCTQLHTSAGVPGKNKPDTPCSQLHTVTSVPGKNKAIAKALSGAFHPSQSGEGNTSCVD